MPLTRPIDAIGPVEAGVEPLRGVRRAHLVRQREAHFVVIGFRVGLGGEIAALPAPIGPCARQPVEYLTRVGLAAVAFFLRQFGQFFLIGDGAPQELRHSLFLHLLHGGGNAGLAEVFLGENVGGHLGPLRRNVDAFKLEDDGPVRIADLAGRFSKFDGVVRRCAFSGEAAVDLHPAPLCPSMPLAGTRFPCADIFYPSRCDSAARRWISSYFERFTHR